MSFAPLEPKEPSVIVVVLTVSRHLWKKVSPTVKWASNLSVTYGSKKLLVLSANSSQILLAWAALLAPLS